MPSLAATHLASPGGGYEPQRKYNWFIYLNGVPGADIIRLSAAQAFLPEQANDEIELHYGNERVYLAGGAVWSSGTLVVRDMVDKDIYGILSAWRQTVYDPTSGNIGFAAGYKKTARLLLTSGDDTIERQFQLTGLWPVKMSPDTLDYSQTQGATAVVNISMTLRYDKSLPV